MLSDSYWVKLAKLKSEMLLKMKDYYQAIKDDKCFEEVKTLSLELKQLEKDYQKLIGEKFK